ncbi:MAG: two-component regulator propeller domain-containing protein [bacterium]
MTETRCDQPWVGVRLFSTLLLFQLIVPTFLSAQLDKLNDSWRWSHFTTQTRLPSNRIIAIEETEDSTIWAATTRGIAWYDDYLWQHIGIDQGLPDSIPKFLVKVGRDKIGVLYDNGVYIGNKKGFSPYTDSTTMMDSINTFSSFDENDYLVMRDINLYRVTNRVFKKINTPAQCVRHVHSVAIIPHTNQFLLNTVKGIYRFDGEQWHLQIPVTIWDIASFHFRTTARGDGIIAAINTMGYESLWEIKNWNTLSKIQTGITAQARSLDISSTGNIIVAYETGVVRIRQEGLWQQVSALPPELMAIRSLKFAHNDDLWVGTEDGLFLFHASSSRWKNFSLPAPNRKNHVHEVFKASDGAAWLGTRDGLIVRDQQGNQRFINSINGIALNTVTAINQDRQGNIWVGSGATFTGTYKWDGRTWTHHTIQDTPTNVYVHKIRKGRDGSLWFLCLGAEYNDSIQPGAYHYQNEQFIHWGMDKDRSLGRVYSFAEDSSGGLWFGSNSGITRLRDGTWKNWNDAAGLKVTRTYAIVADDSGRIWFSDEKSGLGYIDKKDQPQYYDESDGLLSKEVRDIQVDASGRLWLSTKLGLSLYDHGTWSSFGTKSGLGTLCLWENLPLKDSVLVGSDGGGLNILNLAEASKAPRIERNGQPTIHNNLALIRWEVYSYRGEQDQNDIEIRYHLDDSIWSDWTTLREWKGDTLSAGDHVFHLEAKSLFGKITPEECLILFSIEPPFYLRMQFLFPVATLSGMLAFFVVAYNRRRRSHGRELRTSDERFQLVSRATNDTIYDADLLLKKVWFNIGLQTTYGYTEALQKLDLSWWRSRIHPDDLKKTQEALETTIHEHGAFIQQEYRFMRADGQYAFVLDRSYIIYHGGIAARWIGSIMDISDRKKAEETLEKERLLLRTLVEALPDEFALKDVEGKFLIVNKETVRALNKERPEEVLGKTDQDFVRSPLAESQAEDENTILETGRPMINREMTKMDPSTGELLRCLLSTKVPFLDPSGKTIGLIIINRDITSRKQIENQVEQQIDQLQSLYQLADTVNRAQQVEIIWGAAFDTLKRILKTNRSMILLAGLNDQVSSVSGQGISELLKNCFFRWIQQHPGWSVPQLRLVEDIELEESLNEIASSLRAEQIRSIGVIPLEHQGKYFGTLMIFYDTPHHFIRDEIQLVQAVSYHVGFALERRRAEAERDHLLTQLKHSHEQLRSVSRQLLEVQESERRVISRELHDQIGQALTALKLNLQMFQREFTDSERAVPLDESITLVEKVLEQVRTLSLNLHPSILHDLGLAPALRWYVDQNLIKHGVATHLNLQFEEQKMPEDIKMICFRVLQEATTNIMRHAQAGNVWLRLQQIDRGFIFRVHDDGRGFNVPRARADALAGKSLGLLSMQERVELVGGDFQITSSESDGTTIQAEFPLQFIPEREDYRE